MGLSTSSELADNAKHPAPITVGTRRELFNGTCVLFKVIADPTIIFNALILPASVPQLATQHTCANLRTRSVLPYNIVD